MNVRPYRESDFAAVHELMDAASRHWRGEPSGATELRTWLDTPTLDHETDIRLAEDDGELVGYADVDLVGEQWWCDVTLRPSGARRREVAELLLAWIAARASGGRVRVWAPAADAELRTTIEATGYAVRRHSFTMEIELDAEPREPAWPEGITVRTYRDGDGPRLYELEREVWLDTWSPLEDTYEQWAHWTLSDSRLVPEFWHIAEAGGEVAGFANCTRRDGRDDTGWVDVLGVRRPWRRRGLGEALLRHAFAAFREAGLTRAGLGVDAESPTGATRLYERVGMRVYHETVFYEQNLAR